MSAALVLVLMDGVANMGSHHVLTLLIGGKLHFAPLDKDIQVCHAGSSRCCRADSVSSKRKSSMLEPEQVSGPCKSPASTTLWTTLTPASDFADEYPSASVIGTDIAPTQPHWVPPNLQLYVLPPLPHAQQRLTRC